eukprot:11253408-Alexandrium_andersonii.AAC.1
MIGGHPCLRMSVKPSRGSGAYRTPLTGLCPRPRGTTAQGRLRLFGVYRKGSHETTRGTSWPSRLSRRCLRSITKTP